MMECRISSPASLLLAAMFAVASSLTMGDPAIAQMEPEEEHAHAEYDHFYIGVDGFPTLRSGTYQGLANPNFGRLTLLISHLSENPASNHFHGLGSYSYAGSASNPTINPTSANNRIPEISTKQPPLQLITGTGLYANRLISQESEAEYSNLTMKSLASLLSYSEEGAKTLFNSSSGRWKGSLGDATLGLELVSISDGLNVGTETTPSIFTKIGDTYTLGKGDDVSFLPVFWTESSAQSGTYSATFRLRDLSSSATFKDSGTFNVDFAVVPEPSTLLGLGVTGLIACMGRSRLKK
jgi:PEP-CTERM motif